MTEQPQTPQTGGDAAGETPADTPAPIAPAPGASTAATEPVAARPPPPAPEPPHAAGASAAADRPEIAVGAAFAGGFLFAMILRRLAR